MHVFFAIIGILFLLNGIMTETATVQQQTVQTMHFSIGFLSSYLIIGVGLILGYIKKINKNLEEIKQQTMGNIEKKEEE